LLKATQVLMIDSHWLKGLLGALDGSEKWDYPKGNLTP
jgi:hypothetical protein